MDESIAAIFRDEITKLALTDEQKRFGTIAAVSTLAGAALLPGIYGATKAMFAGNRPGKGAYDMYRRLSNIPEGRRTKRAIRGVTAAEQKAKTVDEVLQGTHLTPEKAKALEKSLGRLGERSPSFQTDFAQVVAKQIEDAGDVSKLTLKQIKEKSLVGGKSYRDVISQEQFAAAMPFVAGGVTGLGLSIMHEEYK